MFQRLDKMRKHAFGSMIVFGQDNASTISGVWIWRGHDLAFTVGGLVILIFIFRLDLLSKACLFDLWQTCKTWRKIGMAGAGRFIESIRKRSHISTCILWKAVFLEICHLIFFDVVCLTFSSSLTTSRSTTSRTNGRSWIRRATRQRSLFRSTLHGRATLMGRKSTRERSLNEAVQRRMRTSCLNISTENVWHFDGADR